LEDHPDVQISWFWKGEQSGAYTESSPRTEKPRETSDVRGESGWFNDRFNANGRDGIKSAANNGVCKHNIMIIDEMKDVCECIENWIELRETVKEAVLEGQKRSSVPGWYVINVEKIPESSIKTLTIPHRGGQRSDRPTKLGNYLLQLGWKPVINHLILFRKQKRWKSKCPTSVEVATKRRVFSSGGEFMPRLLISVSMNSSRSWIAVLFQGFGRWMQMVASM
jgi:hypothetical protein